MPAYRSNNFTLHLGQKLHGFIADDIRVILSNVTVSVSMEFIASVTEIAAGNGYTTNGIALTGKAWTTAAGVAKFVATDPVWTASGGSIAASRYAVLFNNTPSPNKPIIGYWDYTTSAAVAPGESLTLDMDAALGVLTIG